MKIELELSQVFGWNSFKKSLRDKFYPSFLEKLKAQEFIELRMGSMSISEYYSKFIKLSRFAPEIVATEELKAYRFERGLTTDLQLGLSGETFISLDNIYCRVSHLYFLQVRKDEEGKYVGDKRKDGSGHGNGGNQQNQGGFKKRKGLREKSPNLVLN